jgi:mannose-1-phosphate guanylyltransferase
MNRYCRSAHRYCVILAGGDGNRLRSLTRCVSSDDRPKQFCPFLEGCTPLWATRERVARGLAPERTLYVVTRTHERYYSSELADVNPRQVLIQPENKGTAPAILLSLLRLNRLDPYASVVFLPSDHHYTDETVFLRRVSDAFDAVERHTSSTVLLGAEPTHPEVGYGWIEPGRPVEGPHGLLGVRRFWEKPSLSLARSLLDRGCLWNTFVMVGRVSGMLEMMRMASPHLYRSFTRHHAVGGGLLDCDNLYRTLTAVDFSKNVLAASLEKLTVLDAGRVGWSDLGDPVRVVKLISELRMACDWLGAWRNSGFHESNHPGSLQYADSEF